MLKVSVLASLASVVLLAACTSAPMPVNVDGAPDPLGLAVDTTAAVVDAVTGYPSKEKKTRLTGKCVRDEQSFSGQLPCAGFSLVLVNLKGQTLQQLRTSPSGDFAFDILPTWDLRELKIIPGSPKFKIQMEGDSTLSVDHDTRIHAISL